MRIHKFKIASSTTVIQTQPVRKFLHVDVQDGCPCVWAEVDIKSPLVRPYEFWIINTGESPPEGFKHVGSYVASGPDRERMPFCVGHIYWRRM